MGAGLNFLWLESILYSKYTHFYLIKFPLSPHRCDFLSFSLTWIESSIWPGWKWGRPRAAKGGRPCWGRSSDTVEFECPLPIMSLRFDALDDGGGLGEPCGWPSDSIERHDAPDWRPVASPSATEPARTWPGGKTGPVDCWFDCLEGECCKSRTRLRASSNWSWSCFWRVWTAATACWSWSCCMTCCWSICCWMPAPLKRVLNLTCYWQVTLTLCALLRGKLLKDLEHFVHISRAFRRHWSWRRRCRCCSYRRSYCLWDWDRSHRRHLLIDLFDLAIFTFNHLYFHGWTWSHFWFILFFVFLCAQLCPCKLLVDRSAGRLLLKLINWWK